MLHEHKKAAVTTHGRHAKDTGSPEVQIAILSQRILHVTEHVKTHKNDTHGRHGLLQMVNKRRKLLNYLAIKNKPKYQELIEKLGLRK